VHTLAWIDAAAAALQYAAIAFVVLPGARQ
jgi:hypothetical protein